MGLFIWAGQVGEQINEAGARSSPHVINYWAIVPSHVRSSEQCTVISYPRTIVRWVCYIILSAAIQGKINKKTLGGLPDAIMLPWA